MEKIFVILVLTLVGTACDEETIPSTSNSAVKISAQATDANGSNSSISNTLPDGSNSSVPDTSPNGSNSSIADTTPKSLNSSIADTPPTSLNSSIPDITTTTTTTPASATSDNCVFVKLDINIGNSSYKISSEDTRTVESCSTHSGTIRWGKESQSKISFDFTSNKTANTWMISKITVTIDATENYMDAKANEPMVLVYNNSKGNVPIGSYYSCNATSVIGNQTSGHVKISNVRWEAFRNSSNESTSWICPQDRDASTTILIAVVPVICILIVSIIFLVLWRLRVKNLCIFGARCARSE